MEIRTNGSLCLTDVNSDVISTDTILVPTTSSSDNSVVSTTFKKSTTNTLNLKYKSQKKNIISFIDKLDQVEENVLNTALAEIIFCCNLLFSVIESTN